MVIFAFINVYFMDDKYLTLKKIADILEMEYANEDLSIENSLTDVKKTVVNKYQFINTVKNGLGTEIKSNPNKVKVIKKPLSERIKMFFKKIFIKF
jgi:hypothetical protein